MPKSIFPHATLHEPGQADDLYLSGGNFMTGAIETAPRHLLNGSATLNNTTVFLSYLTAPVSMAVNNILMLCGSTAGVTPAHLQVGLYTVDGAGAITLVASSTDAAGASTQLLATNTEYTFALTTGQPYAVVRGQRYAIGIVYSFTTQPKLVGNFIASATQARAPRVSASYATGNPTTLPAGPIANASLANTGNFLYAALLP